MKETLKKHHKKRFGIVPSGYYFAPATVLLIGESLDILKGPVLTASMNKGLHATVNARDDLVLNIHIDFLESKQSFELDLSVIDYPQDSIYARLLISIIKKLQYEGYKVSKGLNITVMSNRSLPKNLGLHQSFEMLFMKLLSNQNSFNLTKDKMVRYAYQAEKNTNELYTSVAQLHACAYGEKDKVIHLDTKTLEYETIPFNTADYGFLSVFVSRPKFVLNADINTRIKAIEKATQAIRPKRSITHLSELSLDEFNSMKSMIKGANTVKYTEHVMFEIQRVVQAAEYLKDEDYVMFGDVLEQSQNSLRHLFEISNQYHNDIVNIMHENKSLGARLSIIGYDQIVIALFEQAEMPSDVHAFQEDFYNKYKKNLEIQKLKLGDGVRSTK